jgi:hypothetical protein
MILDRALLRGGVAGVVEILPMAISPAKFSVLRQAARSIG